MSRRTVKACVVDARTSYGYSDVEYLTISVPRSALALGRVVGVTVHFEDRVRVVWDDGRKKAKPAPKRRKVKK
jgi:hypothetical protein